MCILINKWLFPVPMRKMLVFQCNQCLDKYTLWSNVWYRFLKSEDIIFGCISLYLAKIPISFGHQCSWVLGSICRLNFSKEMTITLLLIPSMVTTYESQTLVTVQICNLIVSGCVTQKVIVPLGAQTFPLSLHKDLQQLGTASDFH